MAVHCRGEPIPSQWVPFSRIKACRNQNQLRVELVGDGQDDGLEGQQVLGIAHLSPVERNVHIEPLARTIPYHVIVGVLVGREECGIVIPGTVKCASYDTASCCAHL